MSGGARAAVFGISDGLVSNVALVLGTAGASPGASVVRVVGLIGLLGGAFSMAAGEYLSVVAQAELLQAELDMERYEIGRRPEAERHELAAIYQSRGVDPQVAQDMASEVMRDPDIALETHAREELGINPAELGSPRIAAVSSFVAFALGALVPLVPWFVGSGTAAEVASVLTAAVAAAGVGAALARFTGRSMLRSSLRQLLIAVVAAGVTYSLGSLVGVTSPT